MPRPVHSKSTSIVSHPRAKQQPLKTFTEQAYLNYSMYVILDRALPHIADGLKPVQRRIIYAMSELGLKNTTKFKKSARTIGDVLGKYHPHGDTACYEAMVLMAQPFSYRYPLIEGQGNFGSLDDPKSFAAMRYTEARLSKYAQILLSELEQGTVDWVPNFDGTLSEPKLLPARLPNVLLNGATGIAVGMATDIPPHNLKEVTEACVRLLENPNLTLEEICESIKGPDFPTGGEIITPKAEMIEIYRQGNGTIKLRAVFKEEKEKIVITALPYQVSGERVIEQIADQMRNKKLPMVTDLRDESDHEHPVRLVLLLRSNRVDTEALMAHLFATTELEKTVKINLNVIGLSGKPQVKNLVHLLNEWLSYRIETVRRRLQYRLDQILNRLHILQGLLIVFLNLDAVIKIIRHEDDPKKILMKKFNLTEIQVESILDLKLRYLAKLEEAKIQEEQKNLEAEKNTIEKTLSSSRQIKSFIRKELLKDAEMFGDERRSPLVIRTEAKLMPEIERVSTEPVTIVLSTKGWIRSAKGHDVDPQTLAYKAGDSYKDSAQGFNQQNAIFLDSAGRSYSLPNHTLPSSRGYGEPLTTRLKPEPGINFEAVLSGDPEQLILLASDFGYGFITKLSELLCKNRQGKAVLNLPTMAHVLKPRMVKDRENDLLACVTRQGRLLIFPVKELPILSKGKGNKLIHFPKEELLTREDHIVDIAILNAAQSLKIMTAKQGLTLSPKDWEHYKGTRGRRGNFLPRAYRHSDQLMVL